MAMQIFVVTSFCKNKRPQECNGVDNCPYVQEQINRYCHDVPDFNCSIKRAEIPNPLKWGPGEFIIIS